MSYLALVKFSLKTYVVCHLDNLTGDDSNEYPRFYEDIAANKIFLSKPYSYFVVITHWNYLMETIPLETHNIHFHRKLFIWITISRVIEWVSS